MSMDSERTDNGIENVGYFEDEYSDIQSADNVDENEVTGSACNDSTVNEKLGVSVDAVVTKLESQNGDNDFVGDSNHRVNNCQQPDQELKHKSAITQSSNEITHAESNTGATFYNVQLVDSVRFVTRSQINSKQHKALADSKTNEIQTVNNGVSQGALITDSRKNSWTTRLCTDAVFRTNVFESLALQFVVLTMGWIYALMGPSLPDLQIISGMGLHEASWIFTGYAVGYMIGCAASGLLLIRFSVSALLALSGITAAVAAEILPLIPNGYVMVAMRTVGGVALGVQDTSLTVRLIEIWGSAGGPWIQMSYCMWAFGGIISPLMIKQFLAQRLTSDAGVIITNKTGFDVAQTEFENSGTSVTYLAQISRVSTIDGLNLTVDRLLGFTTESAIAPTIGKSNIHYAYLISALLSVLSAVPFIVYFVKDRQRTKRGEPSENESSDDKEINSSNRLPNKWKYTLLILMCMTSLFGTGCVDAFPNFLTSFGLLQMGDSKEDGSFVTSIFFAMNVIGNLVAVILLRYISPCKYIASSHAVTSVSFTLYYISVRLPLAKALQWTFVAMSGAGMSGIIPTMYTWTQDNVTPVSGRVASAYLVSGSLGVMVTPMFLGYLMENVTPMWFMYSTFLYEGGCIVLFLVAAIIVKYSDRNKVSTRMSSSENNNQINPAFDTDASIKEDNIVIPGTSMVFETGRPKLRIYPFSTDL